MEAYSVMLFRPFSSLFRAGLSLLVGMYGAIAVASDVTELFRVERGSFIQGGMVIARVPVGAQVEVNGQQAMVAADGTVVFGFGRDVQGPVHVRVVTEAGEHTLNRDIQHREYDIQRIDGLPPAKVNPPPETLAQIQEDNRKVAAARTLRDPRLDFAQPFIWPSLGPISGVYGSQRILNGDPKWPHYGVDVAVPTGTRVVAPAAGVVTLAEMDMYYTGGTLIIDHGHGVSSTLMHLSKLNVAVGETVTQGQKVGEVGATGRATGPHLDWRMNWQDQRIDPQLLVGEMPPQPWVCSPQLPQVCD